MLVDRDGYHVPECNCVLCSGKGALVSAGLIVAIVLGVFWMSGGLG